MNILFLCVANSARSQMAEALAKNILGRDHWIMSAGSEPSGRVHPLAIRVLDELKLDATQQQSQSVEDLPKEFLESLDFAITLCADEVCPAIITKAKRLHWAYPDPAAVHESEALESFRHIRDQISQRLLKFAKINKDH